MNHTESAGGVVVNPEARWVEPGRVADLLTHAKDREFFASILNTI